MKKIPTLYVREFNNHKIVGVLDEISAGQEWVEAGEGEATVKMDGSCCAIANGVFYKRYDAKKGKKPPVGAIPCCEPDPVTGHWPHWVKVNREDPGDRWLIAAYENSEDHSDGTYEAIGPHFQKNPYYLEQDVLEKHGRRVLEDVPRDYEGIREYLRTHLIEGIVFWRNGEPQCKIKRSDFGFPWPIEEKDNIQVDKFYMVTIYYDKLQNDYVCETHMPEADYLLLRDQCDSFGMTIQQMTTAFFQWLVSDERAIEWVKERCQQET